MGLLDYFRRPKPCPGCGHRSDHVAFRGSYLEHLVCTHRIVTPTLDESESSHLAAHAPYGCPYVNQRDCQAYVRAHRPLIVLDTEGAQRG